MKPDEVTIVINGRVIRIKGRVIFDWISDDYLIPQKWETHRSISMVEKFFNYDTFRGSNTNDLDSNEYHKTAAENGIPEAQIEAVCNAVNSVSFSQNKGKTPETPEGRIVQDADRLDAIGAVGIGRTFAFGGEHGRPLQDSIRHFYDKLLLLKDQMNTETAKRMAAERHAFLEAFLREWNAELNGEPAEDRGGYDGSELDRRL